MVVALLYFGCAQVVESYVNTERAVNDAAWQRRTWVLVVVGMLWM